MEVGCNGYNCVLDPHMDFMEKRYEGFNHLSSCFMDTF